MSRLKIKKLQKNQKIASLRGFSRSNPAEQNAIKSILSAGSPRKLPFARDDRKIFIKNYSGQ